jgi:RND family efflux transporter MFP subunit
MISRHANGLVASAIVVAGLALLLALRVGWIDILPYTSEVAGKATIEQPAAAQAVLELPPEKFAAAEIHTTHVARESVQAMRAVPGEIKYDAAKRVPVNAPVVGVVLEVLVEPAQDVQKNQPLAILSSPEVGLARDEVLKREAELALARREEDRAVQVARNVDDLLGLLQQRPKLTEVETALDKRMLGDYREKIVGAYSKLLLAERVSDASSALEGGSLSNRLIEERKSAREQAAAMFNGARETARFSAVQERDKARAAAEQAERLLAVAQQSLANLLGPLADMRPITDRERLSELTLLAPISGRIEERLAVKAARVAVGGTLFTVADTSARWVSAEIHERDWRALDFVQQGAQLQVNVPALAERSSLTAKVLFVGAQVSPDTRSVPLVAELPNADGRLKPGMFVWVQVPLDPPHDALVVPAGAINWHENQPFVFVAAGERKFRRVDVQLGLETNDRVEVVSGLQAGDTIVVRGAFYLKSELLLEREE